MQNRNRTFGLGVFSAGLAGLLCLAAPPLAEAGSYGMGSGMMGPGMMASPRGSAEASQEPVNPASAQALLSYIRENNPGCLQCHEVSGSGIGPSFAMVARNYASQGDAEQIISQRIAHGFGRMPAGLASDAQAKQLARRILDLQSQQ